jgi:outer membrane protein
MILRAWLLIALVSTHAITLDECIDLARRASPLLQAAAGDERQAVAGVARAALRPTLHLNASYLQYSEAPKTVFSFPGTSQSQAVKLGAANVVDVQTVGAWTLYSGGRDPALVRAAQAARENSHMGAVQTEADLILRVSQAYFDELAAARLARASADALAAAQAHLAVARARVRAGVAPRLDLISAVVDSSARATDLLRAGETRRMARVSLETAIGARLEPGDTLVYPTGPPTAVPDSQRAIREALGSRPEILALDHVIAEARERERAAQAGARPQIGLNGVAEYKGPNLRSQYFDFTDPGLKTYDLSASIALSLPLLDGGLVRSRVAGFQAQASAAMARRRDLELSVRREVEQAISALTTSIAVWRSDSSRVLEAQEALRLASAAYKGGTGTATDVRDAESRLVETEAEQARALSDIFAAHASLEYATGASVSQENR